MEHSSVQVEMVLKEEMRVSYLDLLQQEMKSDAGHSLSIEDLKGHPHSDRPPPVGQTYPNKTTPSSSATSFGSHSLSNNYIAVPQL